jgi:hypothetical protein
LVTVSYEIWQTTTQAMRISYFLTGMWALVPTPLAFNKTTVRCVLASMSFLCLGSLKMEVSVLVVLFIGPVPSAHFLRVWQHTSEFDHRFFQNFADKVAAKADRVQ